MEKNEIVFGVDVDSVVADLVEPWLARYNLDYDDGLEPWQLTGFDMSRFVKPECGKDIFLYLEDPTLYDEVIPIAGALRGVKKLRSLGCRVVFVTSSTAGAAGRKYKWLKDFGFLANDWSSIKDYVEARDKSLFHGTYLLDDYVVNLDAFTGTGILFEQPWSREHRWIGAHVSSWRTLTEFAGYLLDL